MTTINLHAVIDEHGRLKLDVPTGLPAGEVELEVKLKPSRGGMESCSRSGATVVEMDSMIGRLQWSGDAVREQRRLRDEWSD